MTPLRMWSISVNVKSHTLPLIHRVESVNIESHNCTNIHRVELS